MTIDDEDRKVVKPVHVVGEDLATLSVDELQERIVLLQEEIARIEVALKDKEASRAAADTFFKS